MQFVLPGDPCVYFTKIRPGARGVSIIRSSIALTGCGTEMLARLADRFEMHVYTLGKRRYAIEILKCMHSDMAGAE